MLWEALTATAFKQAVAETGVCVVPLGVMEKHAEHMPLGTDCYIAHGIAERAAEREPAIVYPSFFFGQIYEARCYPGAVNLDPRLLFELFINVLDDIARNGFKKIVIYNGHGGNTHFLRFVAQSLLYEKKPYDLYIPTTALSPAGQAEWAQLAESEVDGHAGEYETALMLGLQPELVHMDRANAISGMPQGRMQSMPPTYNALWYYADFPNHYAGDGSKATVEKGRRLVELSVQHLAAYIAMVKHDTIIPGLTAEFFSRSDQGGT